MRSRAIHAVGLSFGAYGVRSDATRLFQWSKDREVFRETVVDPSQETLPNDELPLKVLLYRYFWPFWLFLDATRGNLYARAHASRHNREMIVYLPTYLKRWGVLCLITLMTVFACDRIEKHAELYKEFFAALVAGAGMAFTWCFAIACIIASIYARLRFE